MKIRTSTFLYWSLLTLFIASIAYLNWYRSAYAMEEATAYAVNTPEMTKSLLILTQGSEFKDAVTKKVVDYFSIRFVFIQVHDVSSIPLIDMDDWDVVVVMHTWELSRAPTVVQRLVDQTLDLSNFIFLATSGNSKGHIEGLDGITGASLPVNIDSMAKEVIERVNQRFNERYVNH